MSTVLDNSDILSFVASAQSQSKIYKIGAFDSVVYQLHYADAAPSVDTFVAANVNITPANTITITAHGYTTGLKVALSGTNLPGGLSATNYFIVAVDANTISLATSLANAVAGTVVTITSAGTTADAALTPAALSQVVKLQQSNDGKTFFDVAGLTVTVTAGGDTLWTVTSPPAMWHKILVTPTTGSLTLDVYVCSRSLTVPSSGR